MRPVCLALVKKKKSQDLKILMPPSDPIQIKHPHMGSILSSFSHNKFIFYI